MKVKKLQVLTFSYKREGGGGWLISGIIYLLANRDGLISGGSLKPGGGTLKWDFTVYPTCDHQAEYIAMENRSISTFGV